MGGEVGGPPWFVDRICVSGVGWTLLEMRKDEAQDSRWLKSRNYKY